MYSRELVRSLQHALPEILFRLRAGPIAVWHWIADRLQDRARDRQFGISSVRVPGLDQPGYTPPDSVHYQPVSYSDLEESLRALTITHDDVLLDFGAGMGRVVCVAATRALRGVIGIEISPKLCVLARRNIEQVQQKLLCDDIRIVHCDAVQYTIPKSVTIFYLFNPFGGAALGAVLEKIAESLRRYPRRIQIVFTGTVSCGRFREEAANHGWLSLSSEKRLRTGALALIYTNTAWTF